jgi:hypothetical protein
MNIGCYMKSCLARDGVRDNTIVELSRTDWNDSPIVELDNLSSELPIERQLLLVLRIIAEVGPTAATFPSDKCLSSWMGACPGDNESAGVNYNHRSPKGNRHMRRLLNQATNAAPTTKGSIFEIVYRRSVPRLGHNQAIGAIAHSTVSTDLVDLASGSSLRRTGPSRHQAIQAKAHGQNDPAAPKPRLSDRITCSSTQPSTGAVIFDPVFEGLRPAEAHENHSKVRSQRLGAARSTVHWRSRSCDPV